MKGNTLITMWKREKNMREMGNAPSTFSYIAITPNDLVTRCVASGG